MEANDIIDSEGLPGNGEIDSRLLIYDWFKNMTTISLVTLGGVLGILQGGTANVRPGTLSAMIGAIAIAGMLGFDGQHRIVQTVIARRQPSRWLDISRKVAMASYGIGVGAFLSLIIESVG